MLSNSLSGYPFCIDFITSTLIVDCKILLASPPSSKLSEKSHLVYILSVFYFSHSTTSTESSCTHTLRLRLFIFITRTLLKFSFSLMLWSPVSSHQDKHTHDIQHENWNEEINIIRHSYLVYFYLLLPSCSTCSSEIFVGPLKIGFDVFICQI